MTTASLGDTKPKNNNQKNDQSDDDLGWKFSLKLGLMFLLSRLPFLHGFLPESLRLQLPTGWNFEMFWTAFSSGGRRFYYDYYCELKQPTSYAPKVEVEPKFQLTEDDIRDFYYKGYMGPFDLVPEDEIKELREYLVNHTLQQESSLFSFENGDYEFDNQDGNLLTSWDEEITEQYKNFYINYLKKMNRHFDEPRVMELFENPAVTERAAQLLGSDLLLWRTTFFDIEPGKKGTELHQGSAWFYENQQEPVLTPHNREELYQVTCWVALTDSTQENGCMIMYPGTGDRIYPIKLSDMEQDGANNVYGPRGAKIDYPGGLPEPDYLEVKAGQFILFSGRYIHGSLDNNSENCRWGLNGRIAKTSTRVYTKAMLERTYHHKYFRLKYNSMNKWRAILLRGEDKYGYNKYE
ncbi:MAG: phytanoyl-CoA dioxygenase family protein [Jaaginema sp. PMC 1079.18]|nr:phytanoyl-CoA dioxygenase family protein [Jaaginema sp. PMC 1080.18]MEC4850600.1 phytanoyl-CoA dioxygenase family protein [Jaaginema sp. PMC 1079.18]MEC4865381.1 phytanoyl-CoA dioxygenase family protein [Jaaginema sp. PMC 1078.18]